MLTKVLNHFRVSRNRKQTTDQNERDSAQSNTRRGSRGVKLTVNKPTWLDDWSTPARKCKLGVLSRL